jgi:hypothetical protein
MYRDKTMKAFTKRILLLTGATAVVAGLLAMRHIGPVPSTQLRTIVPEVVNEPSFWNKLFNTTPAPLADCEALRNWLSEHPGAFVSVQERPAFKAELHYRPAPCTACLELGDVQLTEKPFVERHRELAHSDQYVLRLYPKDRGGDLPKMDETWMPSVMEIVGTDTVPCAFLHVETLPPGVPYRSVLLGFDRAQDEQDRRLVIRDTGKLFGGDLHFNLPTGGPRALAEALNPTARP